MKHTTVNKEDFFGTYYGKLIGKTVAKIVTDGEFYGLQFTDGTIAWISRDEECNGPGFLEIPI